MKKLFSTSPLSLILMGVVVLSSLTGCGSGKKYLEASVPEEQGIRPIKITDETQNPVIGNRQTLSVSNLTTSGFGGYRSSKFYWNSGRRMAISPDGEEIAYISNTNDSYNVMVKKAGAGGTSTQRTFRRAQTIWWDKNGSLYFNDNTGSSSTIGSVDSKKGSLVKQHTSNNNDWDPVVTADGQFLYFTRYDGSGPYIWSLNLTTGELTNCARGFTPALCGKDPYKILCTRNSPKGNSEIWMLDLMNGDETLILSDVNRGFSDPALSPNGQWILVVGNAVSSISKKQNMDIFAVRVDGTQLTQITYHPETDCSPMWSPDGKYIYFISSRANKDRKFCIWRIDNPLY